MRRSEWQASGDLFRGVFGRLAGAAQPEYIRVWGRPLLQSSH